MPAVLRRILKEGDALFFSACFYNVFTIIIAAVIYYRS